MSTDGVRTRRRRRSPRRRPRSIAFLLGVHRADDRGRTPVPATALPGLGRSGGGGRGVDARCLRGAASAVSRRPVRVGTVVPVRVTGGSSGGRLCGGGVRDRRAQRDVVLRVVVQRQRPPELRGQQLARPAGSATSRRPARSRPGRPARPPPTASTRRVAATVSPIAGRSMSSSSPRVSRTDVVTPGSAPGSPCRRSVDSASLASTQSRRSRASAVAVAGSVSSSVGDVGRRAQSRTCRNTASSKSIPPRCSTPSGGPSSRNPAPSRDEHRSVERAAAQVVDRDPVALGHPVRARRTRSPPPPVPCGCWSRPRAGRPARSPGPAGRA